MFGCQVLELPYSSNYELDLEVQWTNLDYDETNEELCIYGGALGSENIRVDIWNGDSRQICLLILLVAGKMLLSHLILQHQTSQLGLRGKMKH